MNPPLTPAEDVAFNHGVRDGEEGKEDFQNPYTDIALREAWLTGYSVGTINRRADAKS